VNKVNVGEECDNGVKK